MKKIFFYICLLIVCLSISGCELRHEHYYNDYGKCTCGDNLVEILTYNSNNEYVIEDRDVVAGETYYYEFVAHGEIGCEFVIDNENVEFERIDIYYAGGRHDTAIRKDYTKVYRYDKTINKNTTYNLKIVYKSSGKIKLTIRAQNKE